MANTWAWPVNGDPHFEIFSRLMGGPLGRFAIARFNLLVNAMIPLGHRLRTPTDAEMAAYRSALPTPAARHPSAILPGAIVNEREFLHHCEENVGSFADLPSLIVWGDKDIAFRDKELRHWQRLLPKSTTVHVPGAGHYVQSDAPGQVAAAISEWADGRSA